jgi:heavy metal efflux system protein
VFPILSPEEIESSVTRPIELEMFGLPGLEQVRSLTRFGISQVCLIFSDGTDLYQARQMVTERLAGAVGKLPRGLSPKLAPPSSGLGEVFTYALAYKPNSASAGNSVEARLRRLKLMQEFVVKPCLKSVKGVAEVNTTGGYDQQMVVEVDPLKLPPHRLGLDLNDIANIVERDVAVGGGALVERDGNQFIIRSRSRAQTIATNWPTCCIKLPWVLRASR